MWIAWNRPSSRTDRVIYFVLSTSFIHSLTTMRCGRWDNNAAIEQLPRSRSRHQLQTVIGKEGIRGLVSAVVEYVLHYFLGQVRPGQARLLTTFTVGSLPFSSPEFGIWRGVALRDRFRTAHRWRQRVETVVRVTILRPTPPISLLPSLHPSILHREVLRQVPVGSVASVRWFGSLVRWFWFQTYRAQRRKWRTAACLLWHARRPTRYEPRTIRPTDPATPIAVIHSFSRPVFAWSLPETNRSFVRSFVRRVTNSTEDEETEEDSQPPQPQRRRDDATVRRNRPCVLGSLSYTILRPRAYNQSDGSNVAAFRIDGPYPPLGPKPSTPIDPTRRRPSRGVARPCLPACLTGTNQQTTKQTNKQPVDTLAALRTVSGHFVVVEFGKIVKVHRSFRFVSCRRNSVPNKFFLLLLLA